MAKAPIRQTKRASQDIYESKTWDVIVIGGGPAGMMAAGRAAERGAKVLLLEKNDSLGKKLLITGGGRCNVTNSQFDNRKLLEKFKDSSKFLFSAFSQWSVKETLDFFHTRDMATKVENELRTFPLQIPPSLYSMFLLIILKNTMSQFFQILKLLISSRQKQMVQKKSQAFDSKTTKPSKLDQSYLQQVELLDQRQDQQVMDTSGSSESATQL